VVRAVGRVRPRHRNRERDVIVVDDEPDRVAADIGDLEPTVGVGPRARDRVVRVRAPDRGCAAFAGVDALDELVQAYVDTDNDCACMRNALNGDTVGKKA